MYSIKPFFVEIFPERVDGWTAEARFSRQGDYAKPIKVPKLRCWPVAADESVCHRRSCYRDCGTRSAYRSAVSRDLNRSRLDVVDVYAVACFEPIEQPV
ncbi:hypothetical protein QFZ94_002085 [Paraburkholderia sp. JPY465]